MDAIRKKAIDRLMTRRQTIQEAYDALLAEPESYGINGAVNVSNRSLKDLRDELVAIDDKLNALLTDNQVAGMTIKWPDYRHSPFGGYQ